MPATEAVVAVEETEKNSYEFAFHVLPTVAEGEVSGVFEGVKALIIKTGGECFDEEVPQHIDLAYEITKVLEGKNRKFHSAYFGWIRFRLEGEKLKRLTEDIDTSTAILRYILIKLTRVEEANPFRYHEARKAERKHVVIEDKEILTEATKEKEAEHVEVSEEELDESLEKITSAEEPVETKGDNKE
jgi:ribosomal protein S6